MAHIVSAELLRWIELLADTRGVDVGVTEPQAALRICGAPIRCKIGVEIENSGSYPAIGAEWNAGLCIIPDSA